MPTDSFPSGTTLSLPWSLADRAQQEARNQGISLNTFILAAVVERVQKHHPEAGALPAKQP